MKCNSFISLFDYCFTIAMIMREHIMDTVINLLDVCVDEVEWP